MPGYLIGVTRRAEAVDAPAEVSLPTVPPSSGSIIADLMTAVANRIDLTALSEPVTVARAWAAPISSEDLVDLRIVVMPEQLEINGFGLRPRAAVDWGVRVWVQQKIEYYDIAGRVPTLTSLCEEIGLLFKPGSVLQAVHARSISVQMRPAFNAKMLDEDRVFSAQIVIVFRLTRA